MVFIFSIAKLLLLFRWGRRFEFDGQMPRYLLPVLWREQSLFWLLTIHQLNSFRILLEVIWGHIISYFHFEICLDNQVQIWSWWLSRLSKVPFRQMIFTKAWSSPGISLCETAVWILWNGIPIERYMISYYGNKSGNRFPDSFHKKEGFLINCEVVSIWYCWCSILIIFFWYDGIRISPEAFAQWPK